MPGQFGILQGGTNFPEAIQVLDRLQYRERARSAQTAVAELRERGVVPMLIGLGTRFGVANRALLGV